MNSTTEQQILVEQRITNEGPSVVAAYLLWFFLGVFSAHRFYLGRVGGAILQLVLDVLIVGLIWVFIDVSLIPRMVRAKQAKLRMRLIREFAAATSPALTGARAGS